MEPQFLPETLEGERVVLRRKTTDYSQDFFNIIDKNRAFFSQWMFWLNTVNSVKDVEISNKKSMKKWDKKTSFAYIIFEKNSNDLIGTISTHDIAWDSNSTTIGYWLGSNYNGKGYMTESMKIFENALFEIGLNRLVLETDLENKKSFGIPERLGYQLDGVMREDCIENNKYRSTKVYSKLRSEWKTD